MTRTRWIHVAALGALLILPAGLAPAQYIAPPNLTPPVPPPAPIPPPKIEVPRVPQLDEIPPQPKANLGRRGSYGKRVRGCLDEAAAMGLGPSDRAAYSRACANR